MVAVAGGTSALFAYTAFDFVLCNLAKHPAQVDETDENWEEAGFNSEYSRGQIWTRLISKVNSDSARKIRKFQRLIRISAKD
ncbi:hypothetical protein Trydic_g2547 [Trypoxylus dichotomus]